MTDEAKKCLHSHHKKGKVFRTKTFRLLAMLSLTFGYFVVELVMGNITNSVALTADAFHMLSDVLALVIAIVAVRLSPRQSEFNTYGWARAEIIGANINTVFLLALCLTILFDAIERFIEPKPIEKPTLLLIVGAVGLGINLVGLVLFQGFHGHSHGGGSHGHSHSRAKDHDKHTPTKTMQETSTKCGRSTDGPVESVVEMEAEKSTQPKKKASMNMHGVFLHVLADALGSVAVIISALLIKFVPHDPANKKHWIMYVDPTLSIVIIIIITLSAIPLFRDTSAILLQSIPKHLNTANIKSELLTSIPEIHGIHELHVWRLTGEKIIASAHLSRRNLSNYMFVADRVKKFFHSIGIHSVTIQYECVDDDQTNVSEQETAMPQQTNSDLVKKVAGDCLLRCENDECDAQTCCTKTSDRSNILLNDKDAVEVFSISHQRTHSQDSSHRHVSVNLSAKEEML